MNFKHLLTKLFEARTISEDYTGTGEAVAKEQAKASSSDQKSKDAARKRVERARQIPRDRKSKDELVREIIAVKTKSGTIQLIFKDSYNKDTHTKLNDQELSIPEASQIISDPKFEQTRASVLLFGDTKEKKTEKKEPKEKGSEAKQEAEPAQAETPAQQKPRKLTPQQMTDALSQMGPEQLAMVPMNVRQDYFKSIRNPPTAVDFDHMSYEDLSVKYGINPGSDLPYNQQVLNALVFLAKTKAGASDQEISTYTALSPAAMEFTRAAFGQARKILSQIGDQCIQDLVSNIEQGSKSVNSEGSSDMQCGTYRFKIAAGGEMSVSTTAFDQKNKNFKGYLASALTSALQQEFAQPSQENTSKVLENIRELSKGFSSTLISNDSLQAILSNPKYMEELQNTPVIDDNGVEQGTVLDNNGNLNPIASLDNYQTKISEFKKDIVKSVKNSKNNPFSQIVSDKLLKLMLRGDGITAPEIAPTHVITVNGVFPMNDAYFNEISKTAALEAKPSKDLTAVDNIANYKPAAAEKMSKFKAIIEARIPKQPKLNLKDLVVQKDQIDVSGVLANAVANSFDFDFNASLLPGFAPKDINVVEFNYVTINGKTTKIPVVRNEKIATKLLGEGCFIVNDILIEALTNNFVLASLLKINLINETEAELLESGIINLLEASDATNINLLKIYDNINARIDEDSELFHDLLTLLNDEYQRDYKLEYRNYHGKSKQRKQRAARTRARELMKKKGIVKKGDGKDIDHRKPLRSGGSNSINNLRVRKKSNNRADNGHKKGEKQNKDWK